MHVNRSTRLDVNDATVKKKYTLSVDGNCWPSRTCNDRRSRTVSIFTRDKPQRFSRRGGDCWMTFRTPFAVRHSCRSSWRLHRSRRRHRRREQLKRDRNYDDNS